MEINFVTLYPLLVSAKTQYYQSDQNHVTDSWPIWQFLKVFTFINRVHLLTWEEP